MKNLANCKPSEFLRQTNRIRKAAAKWLKVTDLMGIRRQAPTLEPIPEGADEALIAAIEKRNRDAVRRKSIEVFSEMLDSVLDRHPDETLEILALLCFIEPKDIDNYRVSDLLNAVTELISDKAVIDFFMSLVKLDTRRTSIISAQ